MRKLLAAIAWLAVATSAACGSTERVLLLRRFIPVGDGSVLNQRLTVGVGGEPNIIEVSIDRRYPDLPFFQERDRLKALALEHIAPYCRDASVQEESAQVIEAIILVRLRVRCPAGYAFPPR